jgi:hypothetical protein
MKRWMGQPGENGKEEARSRGKGSQLPPHLIEELSSILAEALLLDLQAHSNITANSPPRTGRKLKLTPLRKFE